MQEIMLSHEDTIDSLRDEISSIDQLGLEAEANLRRKENEKVSMIILSNNIINMIIISNRLHYNPRLSH